MDSVCLAVNVMGLIISGIVLYGNMFETEKNDLRTPFSALTVVAGLCCCVELLVYAMEHQGASVWMLNFMTNLSLCLPAVFSAVFTWYLLMVINRKRPVNNQPFYIVIVLKLVFICMTMVGCIFGILYSYESGTYESGSYYSIYLVLSCVVTFFDILLAVYYRKVLGLHDIFALMSYVSFPLVGYFLMILWKDLELTNICLATSVLLMYVMMHTQMKSSDEICRTDELTGLLNRKAYEEALEKLKDEKKLGVVYCDINGLKVVNAQAGHEEGDHILKVFSRMLTQSFRKEEIFRISGDEFVVLLPGISANNLTLRVNRLLLSMNAFPVPLASVGYACDSEESPEDLVRVAEKNMHQEKQIFYKTHPEYRKH
ncbi:MAG: diguanylate cyclase [Erysipelotrichaceae bacterium]|mgnify:FL=1|nr:diguanylate cyclase [Erysipelotrichaceae bacterium]